jgi:hypothetical protein
MILFVYSNLAIFYLYPVNSSDRIDILGDKTTITRIP